MHPKVLKADKIRPEYHRCTVYQAPDNTLHAVSTGSNQTSSRLLSTQSANGFAIIPASDGSYSCSGQTAILLIGDVLSISDQGLKDIL